MIRLTKLTLSKLGKEFLLRVLRQYTGYKEMPRVINGLGIAIISTLKV